jgi:hypothetical protein
MRISEKVAAEATALYGLPFAAQGDDTIAVALPCGEFLRCGMRQPHEVKPWVRALGRLALDASRSKQDFETADRVRDALRGQGYTVSSHGGFSTVF